MDKLREWLIHKLQTKGEAQMVCPCGGSWIRMSIFGNGGVRIECNKCLSVTTVEHQIGVGI